MSPIFLGGSGGAPVDLTLFPPYNRYVWPVNYNGGLEAAIEQDVLALDGNEKFSSPHFILQGTPRMTVYKGSVCGRLGLSSIGVAEDQFFSAEQAVAAACVVPLAQRISSAGPVPPFLRMFHVHATMARNVGFSGGNQLGLIFRTRRTGVGLWAPDAADLVDRQGFGVVGNWNAADNWRWRTKIDDGGVAKVFTETVELTSPPSADTDEWFSFDVVILGATASTPAKVQVWVAQSLKLERSWDPDGTSTVLPYYDVSLGMGGFFHAFGCPGSTASGQLLYIQSYMMSYGPVHPITGDFLTGK